MTIDTTTPKTLQKGKHKADYYRVPTVSYAELQELDPLLVYEWVKTGAWKMKHFKRWLVAIRVIEG